MQCILTRRYCFVVKLSGLTQQLQCAGNKSKSLPLYRTMALCWNVEPNLQLLTHATVCTGKIECTILFLYIFNICYSTNFYTYFCDRLQVLDNWTWKSLIFLQLCQHCLLLMNMLLDESEIKLMKLPVFLALIIVVWYQQTDLWTACL